MQDLAHRILVDRQWKSLQDTLSAYKPGQRNGNVANAENIVRGCADGHHGALIVQNHIDDASQSAAEIKTTVAMPRNKPMPTTPGMAMVFARADPDSRSGQTHNQ
jgi:hypothetical protein